MKSQISRDFDANSKLHERLNQAIENHPECATEKSFAQLIYLKRWLSTNSVSLPQIMLERQQAQVASFTQAANQLYVQSLATYQKQGRAAAFLLNLGDIYSQEAMLFDAKKANAYEANSYYDQALAILDEQNIEPSLTTLQRIARIKFVLEDWPAYEKFALKVIKTISSPFYNIYDRDIILHCYYNELGQCKYKTEKWEEADHYWDELTKFSSPINLCKQILANYKLKNWQKINLIIKKRETSIKKFYGKNQFYVLFISTFALIAKQKLGNRDSNSELYKTISDNLIDPSDYLKYQRLFIRIPPEFKFWEIAVKAAKKHQQWDLAAKWLNAFLDSYPSKEEWLAHMLPVKERLYQAADQKEEIQLFSFLRNIAQSHTDQAFVANHQQEIVSLQCACCVQDWQTANQALDQLLPHYQDQDLLTTDLLKACVYIKKQAGEECDALAFEAFLNGIDTIHELSLAEWQQMDATANRVINLYDPKETAPATWQLIHTVIKKQLSKLEKPAAQTDPSLR